MGVVVDNQFDSLMVVEMVVEMVGYTAGLASPKQARCIELLQFLLHKSPLLLDNA